MIEKYPSTLLVQNTEKLEIQKADLDLLKKINDTNIRLETRIIVSTDLPMDTVGADDDIWIQI